MTFEDSRKRNKDVIFDFLNSELTATEIAKRYKLSASAVCRIIKSAGVKRDRPKKEEPELPPHLQALREKYRNPAFWEKEIKTEPIRSYHLGYTVQPKHNHPHIAR